MIKQSIEEVIHVDPGNRGLSKLFLASKGELKKACEHLLDSSCRSVAILTGFNLPPVETDGPLGAVAMYNLLRALGKEVYLVGDEHCDAIFQATGVPHSLFAKDESKAKEVAETICANIDTLISIEVCGPSASGRLHRMSGKDCTEDQIFSYKFYDMALKLKTIKTIGIADGGNELGCGKFRDELLTSDVPNITTIACVLPSDFCIFSGVSNWGGWGLCFELALNYWRAGGDKTLPLPTITEQRDLLRRIVDAGAVDPFHGKAMAVDRMFFDVEHVAVLNSLLESYQANK